MAKRTDDQIIADLMQVEGQLSPENLHADGERSKTEVSKLYRRLSSKRQKLIEELGRELTMADFLN